MRYPDTFRELVERELEAASQDLERARQPVDGLRSRASEQAAAVEERLRELEQQLRNLRCLRGWLQFAARRLAAAGDLVLDLRSRVPQARLFLFEEVPGLGDADVREVLKRVDKRVLATALQGAPDNLQEIVIRDISRRAGELLREEMGYMGPTPASVVQQARTEVANIVQGLIDQGAIAPPGQGDSEADP